MTRPHDFGFDEEAVMLRDSARRLFAAHCPPDVLHRLVASADPKNLAWDRNLWQQMIELGWTAIAVPAAAGGFGMNLAAVAGLAEELGRAAVPSPLIATLCATHVLAACNTDAANDLLRRIVTGAAVSLAITDHRGSWDPEHTDVHLTNGALHGVAWFVQDARKSEAFVVKARTESGVALYIVDATDPGLTIVPDAILDHTRDQARLEFNNVDATRIAAPPGDGARAYNTAEPAILVTIAADMVGAAEWQLQTTAEYARTRVQFDRPIGFFQAVKHPLVDMMLKIDRARTLLYDAACAVDHEPATAEINARMAKSAASDAASFCSGRSVQLHGGIGFTWECAVHLWFKRQKHNEALFGDAAHQRRKLAELLIGPL